MSKEVRTLHRSTFWSYQFWRSVKYEGVYLHDYVSVNLARDGIKRYFDHYNNERQHQSLGYLTLDEVYFKRILEQTGLKNRLKTEPNQT